MLVMLRRDWPGTFRRVLRDENGKAKRDESGNEIVLELVPGEAVEVTDEELATIKGDMPHAIVEARKDDKGRIKPVFDPAEKELPLEPAQKASAARDAEKAAKKAPPAKKAKVVSAGIPAPKKARRK